MFNIIPMCVLLWRNDNPPRPSHNYYIDINHNIVIPDCVFNKIILLIIYLVSDPP